MILHVLNALNDAHEYVFNRKKKLPHLTGKKRLSEMLQDSDGEADISKGGKTWVRTCPHHPLLLYKIDKFTTIITL